MLNKKDINKEDFVGGYTGIRTTQAAAAVEQIAPVSIKPSIMQNPVKSRAFILITFVVIMNVIFYEPFIFSRVQKIILSFVIASIILLMDYFYNNNHYLKTR